LINTIENLIRTMIFLNHYLNSRLMFKVLIV